jgi:hypothetical protein
VPVHMVQARLGHEDPQTTLRVYARPAKTSDAAAADASVDWSSGAKASSPALFVRELTSEGAPILDVMGCHYSLQNSVKVC